MRTSWRAGPGSLAVSSAWLGFFQFFLLAMVRRCTSPPRWRTVAAGAAKTKLAGWRILLKYMKGKISDGRGSRGKIRGLRRRARDTGYCADREACGCRSETRLRCRL